MMLVAQAVDSATLSVEGVSLASIGKGLYVLVGISKSDEVMLTERLSVKMADKLLNLRVFENEFRKMNYSVQDIAGEILLVSQFTLYATFRSGNRPSFGESALPEPAQRLYEKFSLVLKQRASISIREGRFGAHMLIQCTNVGPKTFLLDSDVIFPFKAGSS